MTKADMRYIVETLLEDSMDVVTPLLGATNFNENRFIDVKRNRYKFDSENEILIIYFCKEYNGEIPSNWVKYKNYDELNGKVYKYLFDPATMEPIVDYIDFDSIDTVGIKD